MDVFETDIKRLVLPTLTSSLSNWPVRASAFTSLPAYPFPPTRLPMLASLFCQVACVCFPSLPVCLYINFPSYQFPYACFLPYQLVCSPPHQQLAARIFVLLGCDAVSLGNWFLTLRNNRSGLVFKGVNVQIALHISHRTY